MGAAPKSTAVEPPSKKTADGAQSSSLNIYFAGLFDGEGTIAAHEGRNRSKPRPFVKINMTCYKTIVAVAQHFGGSVLTKKVYNGHSPQWHWVVTSNKAIAVIHALRPYLITKREAADDVLERCTYGVQGSRRTLPATLPPSDPRVVELIAR